PLTPGEKSMRSMRSWRAGLAVLAVGGLVYLAGQGLAGGSKLAPDVRKIADAVKGGDKASAETMAKAASKKAEELGDVMHLFKNRNKGGLGIGPTAQAKSDGIESKLRDVAR